VKPPLQRLQSPANELPTKSGCVILGCGRRKRKKNARIRGEHNSDARHRAYRAGRSTNSVKVKNPKSPAMVRAANADWS
jgi:hypothetical protein